MATTISWTERTWNPTTGCDQVSDGCDNCYALTMAKRLKAMGQPKYQLDGDPRTSGPGFALTMHEDVLAEPLRWRKPSFVFVNSMSDLFHPAVTDDFISRTFAVMAVANRHTFQVLTKHPKRMRHLTNSDTFWVDVTRHASEHDVDINDVGPDQARHIWLGTSVEDQQTAEQRIPELAATPATVRFLSCEPLLGPVNLEPHISGVQWVIVGGESGPKARPAELYWFENVVNVCESNDTAVFVKQLGSHLTHKMFGERGKGEKVHQMPPNLRVRQMP